jgi:hypothetical protein
MQLESLQTLELQQLPELTQVLFPQQLELLLFELELRLPLLLQEQPLLQLVQILQVPPQQLELE